MSLQGAVVNRNRRGKLLRRSDTGLHDPAVLQFGELVAEAPVGASSRSSHPFRLGSALAAPSKSSYWMAAAAIAA